MNLLKNNLTIKQKPSEIQTLKNILLLKVNNYGKKNCRN